MRVTIDFYIDAETLALAISSLLFNKIKVTKKAIKNAIYDAVYNSGFNIISFPEYWGDDATSYLIDNQEEIEKYLNKYKSLIIN